MKLAKGKVSFLVKLAASAASGWAETRHLKPDFRNSIIRNEQLPVTNSREFHLPTW
jgi:hypothetical protein